MASLSYYRNLYIQHLCGCEEGTVTDDTLKGP